MQVLADAMAAHPDTALAAVYAPLFERERDYALNRFAQGLDDVRIPYVKLPRNPSER